MALNRQKLLTELGSVVDQLQSADCGCMGKLFSDSNCCQGGMKPQTFDECRHGQCSNYGGCNPGYPTPCGGGRCCSRNQCMGIGQCNPPKLYADTYSYLNQNLMQPVIKEVYDDLKDITPENTVLNNPMGAKMGMPIGGDPHTNGNMGIQQNKMQANMEHNPMCQSQNLMQSNMIQHQIPPDSYQMQSEDGMQYQMQGGSFNNQSQALNDKTMMAQNQMNESGMPIITGQHQPANKSFGKEMGGMGPEIMKMMASAARDARAKQGGQMPSFNAPSNEQAGDNMSLLPSDGVNPGHNNMNAKMYQDQQRYNNAEINNVQYDTYSAINPGQVNAAGINHPQYAANQQIYNPNARMTSYIQQENNNSPQGQGDNSLHNLTTRQIVSPNQNYGQHSRGMAKFNEMFPGVNTGELGFDPMKIAIQMNPENHKKAAMGQMQNIINSKMETTVAGANAAKASMFQGNSSTNQQQHFSPSNQNGSVSAPIQNKLENSYQQPLFSANTGALSYNQKQPTQLIQPQQQYQAHQNLDSNQHAANTSPNDPSAQGSSNDNNAKSKSKPDIFSEIDHDKMVIKEPLFPVDTSKFQTPLSMMRPKYYDYNTLGQPVEMLPARLYNRPLLDNVPQTLSPQPITKLRNDYNSRFMVKPIESKTSLMGNNPVGKSLSRDQLQHVYRQYKGSQSHTQQRVQPPSYITHSERKLSIPPRFDNVIQAPIEKVGGDSADNAPPPINNAIPAKGPQDMEQIGNDPADKSYGDTLSTPALMKKCRNGLQDQVFTAYPTSTAWSFHGDRSVSISAGYRFRK